MTPDFINGCFESIGAASVALNVRRLMRDRKVAGVHWGSTAFFTTWGAWNLFYYPSLGQWFSFAGGCAIMTFNAIWLAGLLWLSTRRP